MYYYGRADCQKWKKDVPIINGLPFGSIGLATSEDGISWKKFHGPILGGAVLHPSENDSAFDCAFVAISDMVPAQRASSMAEDAWKLFYFGGGLDYGVIPGVPGKFQALPWLPGMATSPDGVHFSRHTSPILNVGPRGDWDHYSVSAPRVLPPGPAVNPKDKFAGKWYMTYHAREDETLPEGATRPAGFFSVGVAVSEDGRQWEKKGKVLSRGEPGTWDDGGIGFRHVFKAGGKYAMVYEACSASFQFALGIATSEDGLVWEKARDIGPQPGGPVFLPRSGEDAWDNFVVGTPYVVPRPDGSLWMYYLGVGKKEGQQRLSRGIGLAVSDGIDFAVWNRVVTGS